MNPFNPSTNPTFTFLFQNPNPNISPSFPTYNFFPNSTPPPPPLPPPLPDLNTTISLIKGLLDIAETTLNSASDFLHLEPQQNPNNLSLSSCPFNPNHKMPPEFLFHHSLSCPSSPRVLDLSILDSLVYPKSLKSEEELSSENRFFTPLEGSGSDLFLSLDEDSGFSTNFFYKNCPGVVSSTEQNSKRMFTLPGILSVECVDFRDGSELIDLPNKHFKILPSDFFDLKREVELWDDYPCTYSYIVLRTAVCFWMIRESDLMKWVLMNSPFYGIVIDVALRDHIYLLLKMCLKAVSREAFSSHELYLCRDRGERNCALNTRVMRFGCPCLVESLTWLGSQLSVLYGQTNGKLFAINMLKESLFNAGSGLVLFPVGNQLGKRRGVDVALKEDSGRVDIAVSAKDSSSLELELVGDAGHPERFADVASLTGPNSPHVHSDRSRNTFRGKISWSDKLFVPQVAAAVSALYERFMLEERIKGLRLANSLSKFQLLSEHAYMSRRADEERQRRSEYKAILEHDGLLWQRSHNQDPNRTKTREELLAEERDYKRRRMSYRGKKVKRTPTLVLREIIEVHMEEITEAGGIGCFAKGAAGAATFPATSIFTNGITVNVDEFKSSAPVSSETTSSQLYVDRNLVSTSYNGKDSFAKDRTRHERHTHHEFQDDRRRVLSKDRQDMDYHSSSLDSYRNHGQKFGRYGHQRGHDQNDSSNRDKYRDRSSSSSSKRARELSEGSFDRRSEGSRSYRKSCSVSQTPDTFEDRYDPSFSCDGYGETADDDLPSSKYARREK